MVALFDSLRGVLLGDVMTVAEAVRQAVGMVPGFCLIALLQRFDREENRGADHHSDHQAAKQSALPAFLHGGFGRFHATPPGRCDVAAHGLDMRSTLVRKHPGTADRTMQGRKESPVPGKHAPNRPAVPER